ncbi:hypothetical protein EDB80DRAFT_189225 [Ilyonectria destructans]|nr:hypothetical protein EDB80DRAFT_189225 [Ilyonectria destructans]
MGNTRRRDFTRTAGSPFEGAEFEVVLTDECHLIKNPTTAVNKMIRQLHHESLLLLSATPISNHMRDINGYLWLMWKPEWPFGFDAVANGRLAGTFYDPDCYATLLRGEEFDGMTRERLLTGSPIPDDKSELEVCSQ